MLDKAYRNRMIPKIVGKILNLINRSVAGSEVLERIYTSIKTEEMKNGKPRKGT
jgi:hypothetical protein